MFSEYASRFLSQSQSRIAVSPDTAHTSNPDRHTRWYRSPRGPPAAHRSRLDRHRGNPYQHLPQTQRHHSASSLSSSQLAFFPFASRANYAPLFYSAKYEINEEDDEQEEHAKEVADFYALQRSRKQLGGNSRLQDSSDTDTGREHGAVFNNVVAHDDSVQSEALKPSEEFRSSNYHTPNSSSQSGPATLYAEEHVPH
ncbi:hypothetical protein KEM54_006753 [Ascosphaera aggregata]|nr:hypothetical protein KEM54_006753 [Ascosphaera aggregata]